MNTKIYTAIIDDEYAEMKLTESLLQKYSAFEIVGTASNIREGYELVIEKIPDLIILDIEFKESQNGFDLIEKLRKKNVKLDIIFISAYDFVLDSLKYPAFGYVMKPIDQLKFGDILVKYIKKAEDKIENKRKSFKANQSGYKIYIKSGKDYKFISPAEILYFKSEQKGTIVMLKDEQVIELSENISTIEQRLEAFKFAKPNRSFLINTELVTLISPKNKMCYFQPGKNKIGLDMSIEALRRLKQIIESYRNK